MEQGIPALLEERTGLTAQAIGPAAVQRATLSRMEACRIGEQRAYLSLVRSSDAEWARLIQPLLIPETWFFRNKRSFLVLRRVIREEWTGPCRDRVLKALSIPCATGEEPYSMAIAFLEAGLQEEGFRIDAVDLSPRFLDHAAQGFFFESAFRGEDPWPRDRYFTREEEGWRVKAAVRKTVRFFSGNLLDLSASLSRTSYDIVFCRNLLIYFGEEARQKAVKALERLLGKRGLLFVGHTERLPFISAGFEALREPGAFAFRPPAADIRKTGLVWEKAGLPFERRTGCREGPPAPVPDPAPGPAMPSGERPSPAPYIGEERRRRPSEEAHVLREARHLADRGAFQEARERCDACIRKDPGCSDAHFLQGLICLALKEEARAEACFNRTLYLNPHHAEALTYLALLLDCRGEREKAGTIRQRVTRLLERGGGV